MRKPMIFLSFIMTAWFLTAEVVTLEGITRPKTITVEDGQIFITENILVHVYSLKDFRKITTFGKRGEGPGEFKIMDNAEIGIGVQISVQPGYILANSIGRISYFTRSGEFIKEKSTKLGRGPYGHNFTPIGDFYVAYGFVMDDKAWYVNINLYDQNIGKVKELYRHLFFVQPGKKTDPEIWRPSLFYISQDRIILDRDDGTIEILNPRGEKIRSIKPQYPRIKETRERIQEYLDFLKSDPRFKENFEFLKTTLEFPEYLPLIRFFTVDDDYIYVLSNFNKKGKSQFFILDYRGRLKTKPWIELAEKTPIEPYPYTIRDGFLYQIRENLDQEGWELHVRKIL